MEIFRESNFGTPLPLAMLDGCVSEADTSRSTIYSRLCVQCLLREVLAAVHFLRERRCNFISTALLRQRYWTLTVLLVNDVFKYGIRRGLARVPVAVAGVGIVGAEKDIARLFSVGPLEASRLL